MTGSSHPRTLSALALGAVLVTVTACSASTVTGRGSAATGPSSSAASHFPTEPPAPVVTTGASSPTSSSAPVVGPSTPAPPSSPARTYKKAITFNGTTTGHAYTALIWDTDTITDCATHAYGTVMINFLREHPCDGARRVLATLALHGRPVDVSLISTGFAPAGRDLYRNTARFVKLERADGTGSINDLLSEGGYLPTARKIPSDEAFDVLAQDNGVTVFDAWYANGPTKNQDQALLGLEEDLYLSPLQDG
jgi:hypothetical protein